jgi:mannosyltransferase OCH1-like enzyme
MYKYILIIILILIFLSTNKSEKFIINEEKIPKIIIQTWKDNIIPGRYYKDIKSLMKNNKDYKYIFFSDNDIEKFLQENYPEYYETYMKLPYKIQKIDFFRYVAVYHYGGFYFDLDISGLESLDSLLGYDTIFPVDIFLSNNCNHVRSKDVCINNKLEINHLLGQFAFAASKNNNFIKYIIDGIHNNIDKYIDTIEKNEDFDREIYIYKTTGPDYVTRMYLDYDDRNNILILKNKHNREQFFGDYAYHNCYGTWK